MPNNWKTYKFKELFDISSGLSKSRDQFGFGHPFATFKDVFYNWFLPQELGDLANTNVKEQLKGEIKKGDIILTRTSETPNELGMSSVALRDYPKSTFNGFCKKLRQKEDSDVEIEPVFMAYFLRSKYFRNEVSKYATMVTRASLNIASINALSVKLPSIEEQKAIASILKPLDDKIENNLAMNKTLEDMAMALYKHWCVDFGPFKEGKFIDSELGPIPEGWEVKRLDELVTFSNGYAFKSKQLLKNEIDDCYHIFKMGHIKKGGGLKQSGTKSWIKKSECSNLKKYVLEIGDILMSMTDMKDNMTILGHTALMNENEKYIVNQRVGLLRVNNSKNIGYPFIYLLTNSKDYIDSLRSQANSGVQVNLSTNAIKSSKVITPPSDVNLRFNIACLPLFEKINETSKENQTLTQFRDTLLPKLISGEVRLKEFEQEISAAL
jgi:type I restriction enzyme S subunit